MILQKIWHLADAVIQNNLQNFYDISAYGKLCLSIFTIYVISMCLKSMLRKAEP